MPPASQPPEGVTLREYIEMLIEQRDKALKLEADVALRAQERAEATLNARLEGMNEFREQLRAQAGTFATHKEVELKLDAVDTRIRAGNKELEIQLCAIDDRTKVLENLLANYQGRLWAVGAAVTVINLVIGIAVFLGVR